MNSKIIAVIVIAIVAVAAVGVGVFYVLQKDSNKEINILAGVNTDGSGLYIKNSVDINTMFDFSTPVPTPIKAGWEGKIFGTPGISTIQHVQLLEIVQSMGMNFILYTIGTTPASNTVYFNSNISNATLALSEPYIDGGSLWQPQYQKIVDDSSGKFKQLVLTNDLFPGHACCVIAGSNAYTSSHQDETVRFLAAYVKAADWVNSALTDGGPNYDRLISIAKEAVGTNFTDEEIAESLETVVYSFGANSSKPLSYLTDQLPTLAEELVSLGATNRTLGDLGFSNGTEFTEKFVNDSYLLKALQLLAGDSKTYDRSADIKVAVIAGDIHQIAIHVAEKLGYFADFGLNVSFSPQVNGPGVATAIENGDSSFGLMGVPPITIRVINSELVTA